MQVTYYEEDYLWKSFLDPNNSSDQEEQGHWMPEGESVQDYCEYALPVVADMHNGISAVDLL